MAVAAPEIAAAAAPEIESLSPEAASAVSAAKSGHGRRLTPEVAQELRRRASRRAKAATRRVPSSGSSSSSGSGAAQGARGAASTAVRQGGRAISGNFGMAGRVIIAFGAFLLALEIASYLSGRYFTYSLSKGGTKLQGAAQHIDLYPGQTQKLALQRVLPAGNAVAGYAGT